MRHARDDYARIQDPENKIPTEEPVFLMRGQDAIAAQVVRYYADLAATVGCDPELVKGTRAHADLMEQWQPKKLPDLATTATVPPDGNPAPTAPIEPPPAA
jgi:hypothetical protein